MSESKPVKIELDPTTARILEIWYETVKKNLFFSNIGEFLLTACRRYTGPYFKDITPEMKQELADMYEEEEQ